jgi:hypothetical protein
MISWRISQNRYTGMAGRTSTFDSLIETLQAYFYVPRAPTYVGGRQGSYTAILSAIKVCRFCEMCQGITNSSVLARWHVAQRSPLFQFPVSGVQAFILCLSINIGVLTHCIWTRCQKWRCSAHRHASYLKDTFIARRNSPGESESTVLLSVYFQIFVVVQGLFLYTSLFSVPHNKKSSRFRSGELGRLPSSAYSSTKGTPQTTHRFFVVWAAPLSYGKRV